MPAVACLPVLPTEKEEAAKAGRGVLPTPQQQPCSTVATEGCFEFELVLRLLGDEAPSSSSLGFLGFSLLSSWLPCGSLRQFHIDKLSLLLKARP